MSSARSVVPLVVLVVGAAVLSPVAAAGATATVADRSSDANATGGTAPRSPAQGGTVAASGDGDTSGGADGREAVSEGPVEAGDRREFTRGGVGSGSNGVVENGSEAAVVQTVTYERTPEKQGWIRATYRYRIGADASTVVVYDYEAALVVESEGFVGSTDGRWRWNGRTDTPSLTMRLRVNRSSAEFSGLGWVDTGEWTLAYPRTEFAFRSQSRDEWVYSWQDTPLVERRTRVAGPGFAGSSVVFLGEHEAATTSAAGQRFRVIRPATAAELRTDAVLRTLSRAATQLRVGARDDRVNAFAGPRPLRGGGMTARSHAGTQDFWVAARERLHVPSNLWVHEYVHTRQNASLARRMTWFREASATYYAGLLSVRQGIDGREGFERFLSRLNGNHSAGVVLARPSTWESPLAPYRKGERVLAALDARIRNATDRNRTLQDVFRRINRFPGVVTYGDFVGIVENVSDTDLSDWLDDHVAGPRRVDPPDRPTVYTAPAPTSNADDDRLVERVERRVGTHPFDSDTDGDGVPDPAEVALDSDPTDPDSVPNVLDRLTGAELSLPGPSPQFSFPEITIVTGEIRRDQATEQESEAEG